MQHAHLLSVRVYYEDTDFSGRVYHASYLRFFERGRTEWLRCAGFAHKELARNAGIAFAVTKLQVEFFKAAEIDDYLEIKTEFVDMRGPVLVFNQSAFLYSDLVAATIVNIVTIKNNRAVRPPRQFMNIIQQIHNQRT